MTWFGIACFVIAAVVLAAYRDDLAAIYVAVAGGFILWMLHVGPVRIRTACPSN